jgi:hypothetical protein
MNRNQRLTTLVAILSCLFVACGKGERSPAPQGAPSQRDVARGLASGGADANGPFDIIVAGDKTASAAGRDASYCVSSGSTRVFALSLVSPTWAVSIMTMGDRPGVGAHKMGPDMMKQLTADLTDKTVGKGPADWVHSDLKSGTLTITRSDSARLTGTYELIATPKTGGEWRARGAFEANPTKC